MCNLIPQLISEPTAAGMTIPEVSTIEPIATPESFPPAGWTASAKVVNCFLEPRGAKYLLNITEYLGLKPRPSRATLSFRLGRTSIKPLYTRHQLE